MAPRPKRVLAVAGTRPEVIKLAPIVALLAERSEWCTVEMVAVEQQSTLLHQALAEWEIAPTRVVALPEGRAGLVDSLAACVVALGEVIAESAPDLVLVQGDTLTAFAAALAASYEQRAVAHVEAGLRSFDAREPFPEETQRRLIDQLADVHYAPTPRARDNLLAEGRPDESIRVVGNTVVDAMRRVLGRDPGQASAPAPPPYRLLVTAHRRESFGGGVAGICRSLLRLASEREDLEVVYVLHSNPEAYEPAVRLLGKAERIRLVEPARYREFLAMLVDAHVVLTDSGGVQEEAPYLGRPVLVTRNVTERPEAMEMGNAELVGTDPDRIVAAVRRLLDDPALYRRRATPVEPFGDGRAAERICDDLRRRLTTS